MQDGQKNGLCHFSSQHSAIGIVKEEDACYLEYRKNGNNNERNSDTFRIYLVQNGMGNGWQIPILL